MKTESNQKELIVLVNEVHSLAVDRGWWDNPEGLTDENLAEEKCLMIITEVAEVVDCYRNGQLGVFLEEGTGKPEGLTIEVADVAIRAMDLAVRLRGELGEREVSTLFTFVPDSDKSLVSLLSGVCQDALDVAPLHVLSACFVIADKFNFDLLEAIRIKHGYNKTRPYRHGGKKI